MIFRFIMGFLLQDRSDEKTFVEVNFWNWRPTVELIRSFGIIDDERLERINSQCCGGYVNASEARRIGEKIKSGILPKLKDHSRIKLDLSITEEPDDYKMHYSDDWMENYSCTKAWLVQFVEFCFRCGGFDVL